MASVLFIHKVVVNDRTLDRKKVAREAASLSQYSKIVAGAAKTEQVPVLYVDGTPTTEQIGMLLNDRLIFLVCLFPKDGNIDKLTELAKVFSGQPWYLNIEKIKVFKVEEYTARKTHAERKAAQAEGDTSRDWDFPTAQANAVVSINELLNTPEGGKLAAQLPRKVPEGQPDTWGKPTSEMNIAGLEEAFKDLPPIHNPWADQTKDYEVSDAIKEGANDVIDWKPNLKENFRLAAAVHKGVKDAK